jgi:outer membrane protein TolC
MAIRLARAQTRRLVASEAGWNLGKVPWTDLSASRRDALDAEAAAWQALASAKVLEAELESRTGTGPERLGWSAE